MEDSPDHRRFLFNDFNVLILISTFKGNDLSIVAVPINDRIPDFSLWKAHLISKIDIAGNTPTLFLGDCRQRSKDKIIRRVSGVQIFLSKGSSRHCHAGHPMLP